ncbi:hypothetical protein F4802DRAFT_560184 [Xylaria palmicola]|nr:hypothetical protein F4802DRAFT_560184 [Xylaria palmicola]
MWLSIGLINRLVDSVFLLMASNFSLFECAHTYQSTATMYHPRSVCFVISGLSTGTPLQSRLRFWASAWPGLGRVCIHLRACTYVQVQQL